MQTRPRARRANVALEFALLLPVWIALVLAIAEFGWIFFRSAALDAAANEGCRAGSLHDPGEDDVAVVDLANAANARMIEVLVHLGAGECTDCQVQAWTVGTPPSRSLVCRATRDFQPLIGLYVAPRTLSSLQVARLEWQREAAP